MTHLLTLLRRFARAGGEQSHGRVVPSDADELGFMCTYPTRLVLIAGEVLDISPRSGSLRLGGRIVDLACAVRRNLLEDAEPSLGLEFDDLPDEVGALIKDYIDARPEREIARRLERG